MSARAGALLLLLGMAATTQAATTVQVQGCDSLRLVGAHPGWQWLEADEGEGFLPLADLPADGAFRLTRPLPPHGRTIAWRPARLDAQGLPDYGDEELWSRPFPPLEARLNGDRLSGRVAEDGSCPRPDLLLRIERDGRVVDLLRLPAGPEFSLNLAGRAYSALRLSWSGQDCALRLERPGQPPAAALPFLPAEETPAAPDLLALEEETLLLGSALPLVITQGEGRLEPAGSGRWRLRPGRGPLAVAAQDARGVRSLPFLWEGESDEARPLVTRSGPGSLHVKAPAGAEGLALAWLDGRGRQGRAQLEAEGLSLEGLGGLCRLQLLRGDEPVWSQTVDLEWPAPLGLRPSSRSDTLLFLELEDPRGWSASWELEWREDGTLRRQPLAASHQLRPGEADQIWLRWRAGLPPAQSRWSSWHSLSLQPDPPRGLRARPAPGGIALAWEPGPWLQDRLELQRVAAGDTLRKVLPAQAGQWLDAAPADLVVEYRLRSLCHRRASEWSAPLHGARPLEWPAGAGPRLARRALSLAEYQAYADETGRELPPIAEMAEGWSPSLWADRRLTGLSPREAMAYANWLNERLGMDGRGDPATGRWLPGRRGGYRLPQHEGELGGGDAVERCWLLGPDGARAPGRSLLRPDGSSRRLYSLDARQPDVGAALVLDTNPQGTAP
jgi:hypothetical protein